MAEVLRYRLTNSCPICHNVTKTCCNAPSFDGKNPEFTLCAELHPRKGIKGWEVKKPKGDSQRFDQRWFLYYPQTAETREQLKTAIAASTSTALSKSSSAKASKTKRKSPLPILPQDKRIELIKKIKKHAFPREESYGYQDLVKRGMTAAQMRRYAFMDLSFSPAIKQYVAAAIKTSTFKWLGSSFYSTLVRDFEDQEDTRYYIPVYDLDKRLSGYQVRLYEKTREAMRAMTTTKKPPKYLWTPRASDEECEGERWSGANEYGERPIQCLLAEDPTCDTVLLVEGILKPILLYERLKRKFTVLGASGGQFASSPMTMDDILSQLIVQQGVTSVQLIPDPGSFLNENVMGVYQATEQLVRDYRLDWYCVDYGQLYDKATPGPDEIDPAVIRESIHGTPEVPVTMVDRVIRFTHTHSFPGATKEIDYAIAPPVEVAYDPAVDAQPLRGAATINMVSSDEDVLEAYKHGGKFILNRTPMGFGKSFSIPDIDFLPDIPAHRAGDAPTEGKIWYVSLTPRTPTTERIESDFVVWPSRHDGLFVRPGITTPLGNPVLMRSGSATDVRTAPNCGKANEHLVAVQHHLPSSQICQACEFHAECKAGIHETYTYLFDKKWASHQRKIRANMEGINPDTIQENDIVIFDEPPQSARTLTTIEIKLPTLAYIMRSMSNAGFDFQWETGGVDKDSEEDLLAIPAPDGFKPVYITSEVDYPHEDVRMCAATLDMAIAKQIVEQYRLGTAAKTLIKPQASQLFQALLDPDVVVFQNQSTKTIKITAYNTRLSEIIANAGKVIFLDATAEPVFFAAQYRIPPNELTVLGSEDLAVNSVQVRVIPAPYFTKKAIADKADKVAFIKALRANLDFRHRLDGIGYIGHTEFIDPGDLRLFSDSRGSNKHQALAATCMFGIPNVYLPTAQETWGLIRAYLPSELTFSDFYAYLISAEIKQALGRLRGFRRQEKTLTFYVLADVRMSRLEKDGYAVHYDSLSTYGLQYPETPLLSVVKEIREAMTRGTNPESDAKAALVEKILAQLSRIQHDMTSPMIARQLDAALLPLLESDGTDHYDYSVESFVLPESVDVALVEWMERTDVEQTYQAMRSVINEVPPVAWFRTLNIYAVKAKPKLDIEARIWLELFLLVFAYEGTLSKLFSDTSPKP